MTGVTISQLVSLLGQRYFFQYQCVQTNFRPYQIPYSMRTAASIPGIKAPGPEIQLQPRLSVSIAKPLFTLYYLSFIILRGIYVLKLSFFFL